MIGREQPMPSESPAALELLQRYDAARRRLLAAQEEKMEATAEFLAVRDGLAMIRGEQENKKDEPNRD